MKLLYLELNNVALLNINTIPVFLNYVPPPNMISLIYIVLLLPISISPSLLIEATDNLTLSHQHPNPEAVVQEVQRSAQLCQVTLHISTFVH